MITGYRDDTLSFYRKRDENYTGYQMHIHTNIELFYMISGECTFWIEGNPYILMPGDVLLIKPSESHMAEVNPELPYERIVVNFGEEAFRTSDKSGDLLRPVFDRDPGQNNLFRLPEGDDAFRRLFSEAETLLKGKLAQPAAYWAVLSALLKIHKIFVPEGIATPGQSTEINRIIRYVNDHLCGEMDLSAVAKKFFISKSQLCSQFKKATGSSFWKYVTVKRLLAVRKELEQGAHPTSVYQKYGFSDYSAFYRAFVKQFGLSPKAVKKGTAP